MKWSTAGALVAFLLFMLVTSVTAHSGDVTIEGRVFTEIGTVV